MGTTKKGAEFVKYITDLIQNSKGFTKQMKNVKILDGGEGKCHAEFEVKHKHCNAVNTLHGGYTAFLVDMITTYALMSKPSPPGVSVDMYINYLKGAKVGECIVVKADTVRAGRTLAWVKCELRSAKTSDLIAEGMHTKFVMIPKPK